MPAKWESCITLAICLALLAGCRTPQPDLKPAKTPERLVSPPTDARYDSAAYPKEAFDTMQDPTLKAMDSKVGGLGGRGGGGGGGGGMPGGMGR